MIGDQFENPDAEITVPRYLSGDKTAGVQEIPILKRGQFQSVLVRFFADRLEEQNIERRKRDVKIIYRFAGERGMELCRVNASYEQALARMRRERVDEDEIQIAWSDDLRRPVQVWPPEDGFRVMGA